MTTDIELERGWHGGRGWPIAEIGKTRLVAGLVGRQRYGGKGRDEQRNPDGRRCRLQREGRRQGNHLRGAGGGAGFGHAQEARRGMGRARRHQPQDRRLRHLPPLEGVRRRSQRDSRIPDRELRLDDALDLDKDAEPGGFVEQPMESVAFGRIAAQQAKQVIVQKVREAERAQVVEPYKDRVGTLVSGVVKRVDRNGIFVDLGGNAEGFVSRSDMIPREAAQAAGPRQGLPEGSAPRAARPAAVPDAHRAGIPDRAVQARSAGSRPGH